MRFSRTLVAVATAALGTFALAGTAHADTTTYELTGTNKAGVNGYCPFDVEIVYVSNQQPRPGPDGTIFTGKATATVTNLDTKKTLTYNVSGPGKTTNNPDGTFSLVAGGPNLLWTTVANSYPGVPQIAYSTGRVQFTLTPPAAPGSPPEDSFGKTTSYSLNGARTDVCAALA
jgi:hypothetical protein